MSRGIDQAPCSFLWKSGGLSVTTEVQEVEDGQG